MRSLVEILVSHEANQNRCFSRPSKIPLFCPWEENFGLELIWDSAAILNTKMKEVVSVKSWNFFLPSEIFSIHSFFFQKILRSPPEKPPAFPTAVYKWWVQLEASVLGSALYAYVARVRRRRPKQFVFSVCADYTNDLDHTWPGPAVTLATYRPE